MKKRCSIKETPELEIQLKDKTYTMLFSNSLFIEYEEEFGNLADAFDKAVGGTTTCEFFSRLMYCFFRFIGEDLSLKECKFIVIKGGDTLIKAMTGCLLDSIMMTDNEEIKKKLQPISKEIALFSQK